MGWAWASNTVAVVVEATRDEVCGVPKNWGCGCVAAGRMVPWRGSSGAGGREDEGRRMEDELRGMAITCGVT